MVHWSHPEIPFSLPPDDLVAPTPHCAARVERGGWIVECPCGGAQWACRTDHRVFCPNCLNAYVDGKWVAVDWPEEAEQIESLLLARNDPKTRNWFPDEPVGNLISENADHGLAVAL